MVDMSRTSGAPAYHPTGGWDEAFAADGTPREPYADLLAALAETDLEELRSQVAGELEDARVDFGGGEHAGTFPLDPVPRLISGVEWSLLERGLRQRARALGSFLADAYGERAMVAAGRVPERVIESAEYFEPWLAGVPFNPEGCVTGLDLVRGADGVLRVLEDNIRTPSGIAYMAAARTALDGHLPYPGSSGRLEPALAFELLGDLLRAAAPDGRGDPSVALLSDGPRNSAWWEHTEIARRLELPIVSPEDLFVRGGRLHARLKEGGTRELQVVYRRTDDDRLRDREGRPTWLVDALLEPCRNGTLTVVNPLGAGLADDKLAHAYVDEMVRFYLGEEPLVPSVRTYDLGDPDVLESTMPRLSELVVKPRTGHGGAGILVGPHAADEDRQRVAEQVAANPAAWVAQETVTLSTHPTVCDGALEPRHVDLRPFVLGSGEEATAAPGALTRVAFDAGALVVNSSQNGGGKDTWILT
ncbi:MAG: circularly permuted type 2 ATP-grasp protein [Actinomycetota bacterium]|nr:circularly permuted type 2 ATP-grasp protein [Actinomycetota bacterium]